MIRKGKKIRMDGDNFKELKPSINNSAENIKPPNTNNGISEIKKGSEPATEIGRTESPKSNIDVNKNTDVPSKIEGKITVEVENEKFKKEQIKTLAKASVKKQALAIGKKSIPVIGGIFSINDAISRYQEGDYTGMFTQIASSAIGVVPYAGTTAAATIQGGLLIRDIYKEVYGVFPENDPQFSSRKDSIIESVKEMDIPAIIAEALSELVKENTPQGPTESKADPSKPEPSSVVTPKTNNAKPNNQSETKPSNSTTNPQQTQVAEKSSIWSLFPSLESIFGVSKPNVPQSTITNTKPSSNVEQEKINSETVNKPNTGNQTPPPVTKVSPEKVDGFRTSPETLIKTPDTSRVSPANPYPNYRPPPTPTAPKPAPNMPPVILPPNTKPPLPPAPIPSNPRPQPNPATPNPVPNPAVPTPSPAVPIPNPMAPATPPPIPVPSPAAPSPNPNPLPDTLPKVVMPTTTDNQQNDKKNRKGLQLESSDITDISKSVLSEPYLIKTAPTLIIYPFIGGDERKLKAKTAERYGKDVRRVREINYEEQRATMEADPPDQPIRELNVEGVPNRYHMPSPKPIKPSPALGRDN